MVANVILAIHCLLAIAIVVLVLLQHGKGADMGASFGSGASGSLFGASGSANFLSRSTAICATVFFLSTLALAFMSHGGERGPATGGTVLDRPAVPAASASAAASVPGAVIPGAQIPGATAPAGASAPAAASR